MPGAGLIDFVSPSETLSCSWRWDGPALELTFNLSPIASMLGVGLRDAGGESKCIRGTKVYESFLLRPGVAWVEANRQAVPKRPCARPGLEMARVETMAAIATNHDYVWPGPGDGREGESDAMAPKRKGHLSGRWMARGGLCS